MVETVYANLTTENLLALSVQVPAIATAAEWVPAYGDMISNEEEGTTTPRRRNNYIQGRVLEARETGCDVTDDAIDSDDTGRRELIPRDGTAVTAEKGDWTKREVIAIAM